MQRERKSTKPSETRRGFLKSTGALAAAWCAAGQATAQAAQPARNKVETLAINGGPKAVKQPPTSAWRWPLYGAEEEKAVLDLVRNPDYAPIDAFEKDWQTRFNYPFVKAQCNGTSALTSMFFALKLPPGSEIMVPSYTFFATIVPMRIFGLVPVFVDIDPRTLNFDLEDAKRIKTRTSGERSTCFECGFKPRYPTAVSRTALRPQPATSRPRLGGGRPIAAHGRCRSLGANARLFAEEDPAGDAESGRPRRTRSPWELKKTSQTQPADGRRSCGRLAGEGGAVG